MLTRFQPPKLATGLVLLLLCNSAQIVNAQISSILSRANIAENVSTFTDLLIRTGAVDVDIFAGTAFLPTNAALRQLSIDHPGRYRRIFTNEQFATLHLTRLVQHHMLPGPRLRQNVITAGSSWQDVSGEIVRGADVLPLVETNINTPILVAHKIGTVLLPEFWRRTVQDIVGDYPTMDDSLFYTILAPPEMDVECPAFWEAHMVAEVLEQGELSVDPTEVVLANDGIVYRIAAALDYAPCTAGSENEDTSSSAAVGTDSTTEVAGQHEEEFVSGTVDEIDSSDPGSNNEVEDISGETELPSEETGVAPEQENMGEPQESFLAQSLPIIIGASIAAGLVLAGCCFGCYCSHLRRKDDTTNYDFAKEEPPVAEKIQHINYVDEETQKEYEDGAGIMLNPDIQEPSFLTLPTFANPNEPH